MGHRRGLVKRRPHARCVGIPFQKSPASVRSVRVVIGHGKNGLTKLADENMKASDKKAAGVFT